MKYIEVKPDIQIMVDGEPWRDTTNNIMKPWSFHRYLENIVLPDPSMGTGYKSLKACAIIDEQFKQAEPNSWIGVEEEHWNMLKTAIEEPRGSGVSPSILRQFIPFMDAVFEAVTKKPKSKKASDG